MNTGPGDAENPAGVFVPAHSGPVWAAAQPAIGRKQKQWAPACGSPAAARMGDPVTQCAWVKHPCTWRVPRRAALRGRRHLAAGGATLPGCGGGPCSGRACLPGPPSWLVRRITPSGSHSGTERRKAEKARKSCWRRAGRGLLTVPARIWAGSRRGRGMNSVTRGSGIALSALVAATASILLLLPGKPAGSWRGPGPPGQVVMASAAATSSSSPPGSGSQPSASSPAGGQPAAGPRPGCRATGAHSGRARAGADRPPARPRPAGGGPARIMPSAQSAPSPARVRGGYPDTAESARICPDEF